MKISEMIDLLGKNLSRIKTVSIGVLIVLFSLSSINSGCNRQRAEDLFEKVTGLRLANDLLIGQARQSEQEIHRLKLIEDSLRLAYQQQETELQAYKQKYLDIKHEYDNLAETLLTVPVEESYNFLTTKAYPFLGEKRFLFNEPQVKGIHKTWLEADNLKLQNSNLIGQLNHTELMLGNLNQRLETGQQVQNEYSKANMLYKEALSNSTEVIQLTEKEIRRLKRNNKMLKFGMYGGTAAGLLTGILLMK